MKSSAREGGRVNRRSVAERDTADEEGFDLVHADILRFFPDLVRSLGADPEPLLRQVGIDPRRLLPSGKSRFGYRAVANLLEHSAVQLQCPDFGLRLAMMQGGGEVFGPMGVVWKNSNTFGEGLDYVAKHFHAHSLAARMRLEQDRVNRKLFVGHEILLDGLPSKRQVTEQVLLLGHLNAMKITGGQARVREVLFRYQPLAPLRTYRRYFGCDVRFDQKENGVIYYERDLLCPILEPDAQLYEMATSFIDARFPRVAPPMHAQVRAVILQFIGTEDCTNERVAAELCLHPRTLHRRLKAEGKSFDGIKDEVRRDVALGYLQQTDLPLPRIAERLGYAEHSVLSRSCYRWFSASPRQLRSQAARYGRDSRRADLSPQHSIVPTDSSSVTPQFSTNVSS
jgi:AraC-like DNA-binding protein